MLWLLGPLIGIASSGSEHSRSVEAYLQRSRPFDPLIFSSFEMQSPGQGVESCGIWTVRTLGPKFLRGVAVIREKLDRRCLMLVFLGRMCGCLPELKGTSKACSGYREDSCSQIA